MLLLLLAIMIIGAIARQYVVIPVGLVLYFAYEVTRHNRPEAAWLSPPGAAWWVALVVVLAVLAALLFSLSGLGSGNGARGHAATSTSTIAPAQNITTSAGAVTTTQASSSSTSTTVGTTSTIVYGTQSATSAGSGQGSIFLKGAYSLYVCGGSSTSTVGVSWKPDVFVPNYSSIGINSNGTCTLYNGNIKGLFDSYYAALAGIGLNASNYTLAAGTNVTRMFFSVGAQNSFVVAIVTGNTHSFGPYLLTSPVVSYPPGASFDCNVTEQQDSTAVRENATSFVKSTVSLVVCPQASAGNYLLSEANLTDSSFAVYVFRPR